MRTSDGMIILKNYAFRATKLHSFGLRLEKTETFFGPVVWLNLEKPGGMVNMVLYGSNNAETVSLYAELMTDIGNLKTKSEIAAEAAEELKVDLAAKPQTTSYPLSHENKSSRSPKDGTDHLDGQ